MLKSEEQVEEQRLNGTLDVQNKQPVHQLKLKDFIIISYTIWGRISLSRLVFGKTLVKIEHEQRSY
jgi:hypothetical protein